MNIKNFLFLFTKNFFWHSSSSPSIIEYFVIFIQIMTVAQLAKRNFFFEKSFEIHQFSFEIVRRNFSKCKFLSYWGSVEKDYRIGDFLKICIKWFREYWTWGACWAVSKNFINLWPKNQIINDHYFLNIFWPFFSVLTLAARNPHLKSQMAVINLKSENLYQTSLTVLHKTIFPNISSTSFSLLSESLVFFLCKFAQYICFKSINKIFLSLLTRFCTKTAWKLLSWASLNVNTFSLSCV